MRDSWRARSASMKRLRAVLPAAWARTSTSWIRGLLKPVAERVGGLEKVRCDAHMASVRGVVGRGGSTAALAGGREYTPRFFDLTEGAQARPKRARWLAKRRALGARMGEAPNAAARHSTARSPERCASLQETRQQE